MIYYWQSYNMRHWGQNVGRDLSSRGKNQSSCNQYFILICCIINGWSNFVWLLIKWLLLLLLKTGICSPTHKSEPMLVLQLRSHSVLLVYCLLSTNCKMIFKTAVYGKTNCHNVIIDYFEFNICGLKLLEPLFL